MTYCLISWGANSHGQLGQGIQSEECDLPREVDLSKCSLEPQKIKKIVGGAGHTLILDDYGRVYSCGWNSKGQVGFPMKENILFFQELNGKLKDKYIVDIACGWDCSAALTIEGTLFLWGSNHFGQLGKHPNHLQWTHEPFEVIIDQKIKGMSIGLRHTVLITEDHKILVAGTGSKGQLGLCSSKNDETLNVAYTFTEVLTLPKVMDVSCGQHHTVTVTENGDFYVFGDNKYGQLGLNTNIYPKTFSPIKSDVELKFPINMYSGWSHVIVLKDSHVFGWGRNTYGQLGITEAEKSATWKATQIKNLSKIRQVSAGSEHNVALTEDGKILCWGWNEHGNCGNGNKENVEFPQQLLLSYDCKGILIGTGAAHSFAVIKILCKK
ncbi:PREDICTED: secretion-regulating guanine nucleotide exchange factor-like [Eufriesea mexicana]|uniref:secretion-regulating guanine nucleotide exchange factor-like n=1 Tax=Eufriesea mexicana TaxID=516756 RepID=UPI00083C1E31|nr:PREDICTED: secretion-regulating guanine nucleotide exchange factor-like [Eufriesea mexicana]